MQATQTSSRRVNEGVVRVDISGRRLARNTALNLAGRVVPLLVAIVPVSYVVHRLGPDRYGIIAALLPFDFASGSMQGVLGASRRFDLQNAVSISSSTLSYLLPVAALALGFGLLAIVLFLAVARLATLAVVFALCLRLYPSLRRVQFDFRLVRSLFGYGRWIAVSGLLIPILKSFEKLAIATLVSVGALTYMLRVIR